MIGGWARKFDSLAAVTGCTAVAKNYFCNYHLQPKDGEYAKLLNWILEGWAKECESSPSVNSHLPGANKSTTGFHLNWLVVRWAKECDRYWQLIRCWKKWEWDPHLGLTVGFCIKFILICWLGAKLQSRMVGVLNSSLISW